MAATILILFVAKTVPFHMQLNSAQYVVLSVNPSLIMTLVSDDCDHPKSRQNFPNNGIEIP